MHFHAPWALADEPRMTTTHKRSTVVNVLQKNWQDLIKPGKLDVTPGREKNRVATMIAEPHKARSAAVLLQ